MDGSQLPTEWTHLKEQLVPAVSDSKRRDAPLDKSGTASKNGPMSKKKEDVKKMSEMPKESEIPDASQNLDMAKSFDSDTNRKSKKNSSTSRGDLSENTTISISQKAIRAATPTPEKKPEVHRTSKDK
jgi:hypothetical protein